MRRMEACAWVDRRHLRASPDQAIDAVGDPLIFCFLRRRVPQAQGKKADPLRELPPRSAGLSITIGHVRTLHPWIAKSWVLIRGLSGRSRSLPARKLCNDAPTAERILLDGARVSKSLVSFSRRALLYPNAIATLRAMYGRNSSIRTKLVMLVSRSSRADKSGVLSKLKPPTRPVNRRINPER